MIRPIRPTDLPFLITSGADLFPNQARTQARLGRGQEGLLLSAFAGAFAPFSGSRRTWVCTKGGHISALVSLQRRSGRSAWEVDAMLHNPDGCDDDCVDMIERAGFSAGQRGADKLFLRLADDSPSLETARAAGFCTYQRETLFRAGAAHPRGDSLPACNLRRRTKHDEFALFMLFNHSVPEAVRRAEGCTFDEWRATREQPSGDVTEYVLEREGNLIAWLRLVTHVGAQLSALIEPAHGDVASPLIDQALRRLSARGPVLSLVPESCPEFKAALLERDFEATGTLVSMVREVTARATRPSFVPAQA